LWTLVRESRYENGQLEFEAFAEMSTNETGQSFLSSYSWYYENGQLELLTTSETAGAIMSIYYLHRHT
jgi:antitoxin component YwqK of YwqJK toxin-antitoxin module